MSTPYRPLSGSPTPPSPPSRAISPSTARSPSVSLRQLELTESFPHDGPNDLDPDRPSLGRIHRSSTITSLGGFDFREGLLPLTLSGEDAAEHHGEEKHVGMLHGESRWSTEWLRLCPVFLTLPSYGTRRWDAGRLRHLLLTRSSRRRGGQRGSELGHLGCERSAGMDGGEVSPGHLSLEVEPV